MSQDQNSVTRTAQAARNEAGQTAEQAREAGSQVASTVGEQGRAVAREATTQVRDVAVELRERARGEVESQGHRFAQSVRQLSNDLASMAEAGKPDSPVRGLVGQAADRGRHLADYLDERGFGGAVDELQKFARRRPGVFLAGAVLAGFAVGRVARATMGGGPSDAGDRSGEPGSHGGPPAVQRGSL